MTGERMNDRRVRRDCFVATAAGNNSETQPNVHKTYNKYCAPD
jgi:hypothetical protein